jgi:fibronectin type 3 domain-containing protein
MKGTTFDDISTRDDDASHDDASAGPAGGPPTIVIAEAPAPGLVYIEWQAPPNTTVTGYRVYRGTTSGGEVPLLTKGGTALSASDVHVTPGVTYYYVVTALSAAGGSPWSNEVAVTAV